jgi:hypothetical protein
MAERKPMSKKLRFEVFKRDSFTCQYCGKTPPLVVLEVDHIHPVSKGGSCGMDNLISACFDCNRGKAANLLTSVPMSLIDKSAIISEREEQLKAFNKLLAAKRKREDRQIDQLIDIFEESFKGYTFLTKFKESVRSNFLPYLTQDQLITAISKACSKCGASESALKYFCGICWTMRRDADGAS